jgi:hypothetical protein
MKKGAPFAAAFLAVVLSGQTTSRASDHIDGVATTIDNAADLTDLYTFTSPRDANKLVMVLNVHTLANSKSRFSNAVDFKFRIRPIDDARTLAPSTDPAREQSIVCSFSGGMFLLNSNQRATCRFDLEGSEDTIVFDTRTDGFRAGGMAERGDIKVFAGVRSDTWFLDLAKTLKYNRSLPVLDTPGINGLWGQNVLSIVVEVDKRRLGGPLLAITAQTVRR